MGAIIAQKAKNELELVQAQEATALLEAHKRAGTLDAYIQLETAKILAESNNVVIANPNQEIQLSKPSNAQTATASN